MAFQVLVANDYGAPIGKCISCILGKESYRVVHAETVSDLEQTVQTHQADLMMFDYRFAEKNGLELADAYRIVFPQTPQILFTAYWTKELASECEARRMLLMKKPFWEDGLREIVRIYERCVSQGKPWQDAYHEELREYHETAHPVIAWMPRGNQDMFYQMMMDLFDGEVHFARQTIRDKATAKQIVQEAFDTIYNRNPEFSRPGAFQAYLRNTVHGKDGRLDS